MSRAATPLSAAPPATSASAPPIAQGARGAGPVVASPPSGPIVADSPAPRACTRTCVLPPSSPLRAMTSLRCATCVSAISMSGTSTPSRGIDHPVSSSTGPPEHPLSSHSCAQRSTSITSAAPPLALIPTATVPGSGASALTVTSHCTGFPGTRLDAASQSATETTRRTSPCTTCVEVAAHAGPAAIRSPATIAETPVAPAARRFIDRPPSIRPPRRASSAIAARRPR